jgi:hypothetical protein
MISRNNKRFILAAIALSVIGCGGSDKNKENEVVIDSTVVMSGKVIDGYMSGIFG